MSARENEAAVEMMSVSKPVASLTASLIKRAISTNANIIRFPIYSSRRTARPLPRLQAMIRSRDTRLFISVSSAAFTFILGFVS
jgi:hypothetical protein